MNAHSQSELVSIKIHRSAHRLLKTICSWKEVDMMDYISELVEREVPKELARIANELDGERDKKKAKT
jgi:hypothetical protein